MAEGFARQLAQNGDRIYSAGTNPKGIHPFAVKVMREVGIDISTQQSKGLEAVPLERIDQLITLCGDAAESCPVLPGKMARAHWPLADPAAASGTEAEVLPIFREVRDQIKQRVQALFPRS
jgi:arsenate reductase